MQQRSRLVEQKTELKTGNERLELDIQVSLVVMGMFVFVVELSVYRNATETSVLFKYFVLLFGLLGCGECGVL